MPIFAQNVFGSQEDRSGSQEDNQFSSFGWPHSIFDGSGHEVTQVLLPGAPNMPQIVGLLYALDQTTMRQRI